MVVRRLRSIINKLLVVLLSLQPVPQSGSALSLPAALGVVGVVLPDESPLLSMVTLLGAAVGNGNAVVMVPSEKYPLPALALIPASDEMSETKV